MTDTLEPSEAAIMTQTDELREKVREAVCRAWHEDAPSVIARSTDAIMQLMEQVRADERERLAKLAETQPADLVAASAHRCNRIAAWLRAQKQ